MTADEFFTPRPMMAVRRVPMERLLLLLHSPVFPVINVTMSNAGAHSADGSGVLVEGVERYGKRAS